MTSSNYKKHSISPKKQYDPKEMEEVIVLLTKQVKLLERVKELMGEIAEFKVSSTPTYFPYYYPNYYPSPLCPPLPYQPPWTWGTTSDPSDPPDNKITITCNNEETTQCPKNE